MKLLRTKWVWLTLVGVFFVEVCSALSYIYPGLESWFYVLIISAVAIIAASRLRIGVGIVLAELIIGSKGHLLAIPLGDIDFSLRMGLFSVLLLATGSGHCHSDLHIQINSSFKASYSHVDANVF